MNTANVVKGGADLRGRITFMVKCGQTIFCFTGNNKTGSERDSEEQLLKNVWLNKSYSSNG